MTSSRSRASRRSRWILLAAAFLLGVWVVAPGVAEAGARKRVVVLEFEGPKAEKFHEDLVKLIKKTHTVIPVDKWNGAAEELNAAKLTDKNIKKVAKKLKVDAIVQGKVDKRRDEYILRLKLRAGTSGELVGNPVETKAEGPRLDGKATRDLKDELLEQIGGMDTNRDRGRKNDDDEEEDEEARPKKTIKKEKDKDEEEDESPKRKGFSRKDDDEEEEKPKKTAKKDDEEEEEKPKKTAKQDDDEEEEKPKKTAKQDDDEEEEKPKKTANKDDDEEEEDEEEPKADSDEDEEEEEEDGGKRTRKRTASRDDEEEGITEEAELEDADLAAALSPNARAVDLVAGLSFNARRLSWKTASDLMNVPPPYKGVPVAGLLIDATIFPGAMGHKRKGFINHVGVTAMYDRVLLINSKAGNPPVKLPTTQQRWAIGAALRYPMGKVTLGASVRYGRQMFSISPAEDVTPQIPNVQYTIVDPQVSLRYAASPKLTVNLSAGFLGFFSAGQIQKNNQYGPAKVSGFEGEVGGDYMLTNKVFMRAALRFETIGFDFNGDAGTLSVTRDNDNDQDVYGARDNYLGGAVAVGYLY